VLPIGRVVGPGTADQFDGNGFLVNWDTYTTNGILSSSGELQVALHCLGDSCVFGQSDLAQLSIYANGHQVSSEPITVHVNEDRVCASISTKYLKFPQRGQGGAPNPALNNITFAISGGGSDVQAFVQAGEIGVQVGTLSIKAMAPIVLVHGWNAGPWVWGPKPATGVCGANVQDANDGGQNLYQSLLNAKAPVDCSFSTGNRPSQSLIDEGAARLGVQLPGILVSFGTRHVNLVTHSKGGLFAREFLQLNARQDPTSQIGVVSATTLEAPHHGSALSDTVVAARSDRSVLPGFVQALYPFLMAFSTTFRNAFGAGNNDMTVDHVENVFNVAYATPPDSFTLQDTNTPPNTFTTKPFYYSTSANADLNGNHVLDGNERVPYGLLTLPGFRYQRLSSVTAIPLHQDSSGRLVAVPQSSNVFLDNDLGVTVQSARYQNFQEIGSFLRNHSTIRCGLNAVDCANVPGNADIAPLLLQMIQAAENQQPQP
jgi:triacylglycerol esterase/lipase EstA (alpha/beta hydrolase family)